MIPVLTPTEMKAVDETAPDPVEVLVARAGTAVAKAALALLGGGYGRRVVVVAGKGNNGADGRYAAGRLRRRGVRVDVLEAADGAAAVPPCDLVIDAAYGTGFRGEYRAPDPGAAPVLAVDIPSGVNGLTGEAADGAVRAGRTVTFAALKPGLLLARGPALAGAVEVADIGLDASSAQAHLVETADVAARLPARPRDAHKWRSAVWAVAGSPGMAGAAALAARAALRAGAGTVRLGSPGLRAADHPPGEVVARSLPVEGWDTDVLADADRAKAILAGPGLGRSESTFAAVRRLLDGATVPVVLDADGLLALGDGPASALKGRTAPTVLTPHEGEFGRLTGSPPGPDRLTAVRDLAAGTGAVVLLKGAPTVVAEPGGAVLLSTAGDPRLASAGTGDVLAGVVAAFLAMGLEPVWAAAAGAHVHGLAGRLGFRRGLVAGDLLGLLPRVLSALPEG